jgi:aspartate-semialdehyde dehydrogenase
MGRKEGLNVAVVGATGAVGQCMVEVLEQRNFPVRELKLLASDRSAGKRIKFHEEYVMVEDLGDTSFNGIQMALFSAGAEMSREYVPQAVRSGAVVIDNTSCFRMEPDIPLVVPEINCEEIKKHRGIIANPNCSTIQMVLVLNPIHQKARIRRIVVSTYQSVSGAGKVAILELREQVDSYVRGDRIMHGDALPHPIAFNVIPQIDSFSEDGSSLEELKMVNETRKILGDSSIQVSATCVRVPVFYGHSESVNVETEGKLSADEVRTILSKAPGVKVYDDPKQQRYPMPTLVAGGDDVFVGRIREDHSVPNGLNLWIVGDNLRKGAALNAVQIAEELLKRGMIG